MTYKFDNINNVRLCLSRFAPYTAYEDTPHGVPAFWGYYSKGKKHTLVFPYNFANWWGVIYVNLSNYHAPNTRVAVKNIKMLFLYDDELEWRIVQTSESHGITSAGYPEDFSNIPAIPADMRTEQDGSVSFVQQDGYNAHFYPMNGFIECRTNIPINVIVIADTKLVLNDQAQIDDRDTSSYLISMGADYRMSDNTSPYDVVLPFGDGKFVKVTKEWRTVVMSTISNEDLAKLPMPPSELFILCTPPIVCSFNYSQP
jgi:hypothetical protein